MRDFIEQVNLYSFEVINLIPLKNSDGKAVCLQVPSNPELLSQVRAVLCALALCDAGFGKLPAKELSPFNSKGGGDPFNHRKAHVFGTRLHCLVILIVARN